MTAFTLALVQDALHAPRSPDAQCPTRIVTDSRNIAAGDVFVALVGEQFDGHDYVAEVLARGAVAVVVSREMLAGDSRQIMVDDTLVALGCIANAWRCQLNPKVLALTGSNGKTTVKEMCAAILRHAWGDDAVLATAGNFNNEIGMPLTLLRLQDAHQVAVVEMGMNHVGELTRLTHIAQPDVALITNASRAHIGNDFDSVADIARAKAEVYAGLNAEHGVAILPLEDTHYTIFEQAALPFTRTTFGVHQGDIQVEQLVLQPLGSEFILSDGQARTAIRLPVPGEHNVHNAAAAAAATRSLGVAWEDIAAGLAQFRNAAGRLQGFTSPSGALVVDDTYNANPDSMKAALDVLARFEGDRVFVMGAIGELGAGAWDLHAEVGAYANHIGLSAFLGLGHDAQAACKACAVGQYFDDLDGLLAQLSHYNVAGNTILVKGSRFMQMERVVAALLGTPGK